MNNKNDDHTHDWMPTSSKATTSSKMASSSSAAAEGWPNDKVPMPMMTPFGDALYNTNHPNLSYQMLQDTPENIQHAAGVAMSSDQTNWTTSHYPIQSWHREPSANAEPSRSHSLESPVKSEHQGAKDANAEPPQLQTEPQMTTPTQISPKEWNAVIESLGQLSPNENPQHPKSHIAVKNRPSAPGSVQKHQDFIRPTLMRNSIMPTLTIPKMPWPPTLVVSSMPSPNTAAAFPIARKRPAPAGLPPLQLPSQPMQLNFKTNKALAASKKKQQKLTATAAAGPSNKIGGEGQKQIIAATQQHQRTAAGSAFLSMAPTSQARYIVDKCLLSLGIRHFSTIIIEPIARIQRGEPVVESLTNAKLALALELRQMVPFEVAKRLKQSVVDNVYIKSSNIFAQIIEEIKTNSIATFGQTLLTRDEVVNQQQNSKAPEIEENIGCANVLFFLSRLFRKLAGLLSAPYDEQIEFSVDLRTTRRVALALWLSGMREQFVLEFERFTTFLAFGHRDKFLTLKQLDALDTAKERLSLAHLAIESSIAPFVSNQMFKLPLKQLAFCLSAILKQNFACLILSKNDDVSMKQIIEFVVADQSKLGIACTLLTIIHQTIMQNDEELKNQNVTDITGQFVGNLIKMFAKMRQYLPSDAKTPLANQPGLAHGWDLFYYFLDKSGQQLDELARHLANAAEDSKNKNANTEGGSKSAKTESGSKSAKMEFWKNNCAQFFSANDILREQMCFSI
uniref:Uncharacterized protein n=1 Tax=Globodera rostochiensis TaxID=31243 RepID=A0A914I631_GLORO